MTNKYSQPPLAQRISRSVGNPSWQRAFLLYLVLPLLALTGVAINVALNQAREFQDDRLRDDLELIGRAIRLPLSEALVAGDVQQMQTQLDAVFEIGRIYGASVYDTNGELVVSAGVTELDLSESVMAEQVLLTGEQQDSYREVAGLDMFSQFIPMHDRNQRLIGFMQLNRQARDFDRSFARLEQIAWIAWGVVTLVVLTILAFGYYRTRLQQQVELQSRLREHEKMAAIGQLARGVAHELGAPLTVISGRAKRLLKRHTDTESQRQLTAISGQVERLTNLVQQLLDFSRAPVNAEQSQALPALIEQAARAIGHENDGQVQLQITQVPAQATVQADTARLELALVNLFRNALQAAASQVTVSVETAQHGYWVVVADDGPGLPQDTDVTQLIEPFATTKPIGEGTGLGLAIVAHVVSAHHGKFLLQNRPSGGCQARIFLPRTLPKDAL